MLGYMVSNHGMIWKATHVNWTYRIDYMLWSRSQGTVLEKAVKEV